MCVLHMVSVSTTTDRYCKFELAHDLSKKAQNKAKKKKNVWNYLTGEGKSFWQYSSFVSVNKKLKTPKVLSNLLSLLILETKPKTKQNN